MSLTIDLAPIAYEQSDASWLPGRSPYLYQQQIHQLVRETLERKKTLCLFLVTPTGSGKTLASYAHSILSGEPVLGVYPTNELITDQERALRAEVETVGKNRVLRVDSNELDRWQIAFDLKRHSETLEALLRWQPVLLTNPDILFYLFFGLYQGQPGIAQRLFTLVADVYSTFVFDEFHLYNIKQVADVAFLIGALQRINPARGRVFLFASATPSSSIIPLLREKIGLLVKVIEGKSSESPQAKTIAHPVQLTLIPADLERWRGTTALTESIEVIDAFRQGCPFTERTGVGLPLTCCLWQQRGWWSPHRRGLATAGEIIQDVALLLATGRPDREEVLDAMTAAGTVGPLAGLAPLYSMAPRPFCRGIGRIAPGPTHARPQRCLALEQLLASPRSLRASTASPSGQL